MYRDSVTVSPTTTVRGDNGIMIPGWVWDPEGEELELKQQQEERLMYTKNVAMMGFAFAVLVAATAAAQQPAPPPVPANPTQNCTLSPAEIAANRKVALAFFGAQGDDRVALADPSYKQHNPQFKKRAEDNKVTDFEEFKNSFGSAALAARQGGPGGGAGRGPGAGPQAPPGNQFEVVTTECDITVVIHKANRPDPTTPGRFFEAFTFDAFRVRNGKLVEHWDTAVINPPAPAGGGPAGGAPAGRGGN